MNRKIERCCGTCGLNAGKVCAGSGTRLDNGEDKYGMPIAEAKKMFPNGCDDWELSFATYQSLNIEVPENFMSEAIKKFNNKYPQCIGELHVFNNNNYEIKFGFRDILYVVEVLDLYNDHELKDLTDDEVLWLNVLNIFDYIIS